jgi:3-hydroxyisobutyrate dehydrogenase-like beta-hydroxyacid dehydrogenase
MRIALLGVGLMGYPMGRQLCDAGHQVVAWNRTSEKARQLLAHGSAVATSPKEAVVRADLVLVMLENGQAVQDVLFNQSTLASMQPGTLVMDMSSIQPAEAQHHADALQALGFAHLDAPVSGGTVGAEAGSLAIMVGGQPEDFARALPVLDVLGTAVHVGSHGTGQVAMLANQMIVGITIGAVAEALLFARQGGADMAKVREAICGGFAESRVLEVHGRRMIERDFLKRGAVDVQLKNLNNALFTAERAGFKAPITKRLASLFRQASAAGWGNLDHSALFLLLDRSASTQIPTASDQDVG